MFTFLYEKCITAINLEQPQNLKCIDYISNLLRQYCIKL